MTEQDATTYTLDRRDFLKKTTAGLTLVAGAAYASSPGSEGVEALAGSSGTLRLEGWRVRPGAQVAVTGQGPLMYPRALLVRVDEQGQQEQVIGQIKIEGSAEAWRARFEAPQGKIGQESYHLALAWPQARGQWRLSNNLEVICAPFLVGM